MAAFYTPVDRSVKGNRGGPVAALYAVEPVTRTGWTLAGAVVALYFLHQDIWFWSSARPLVFGFLPIGLFYHAVYSVAAAGMMWALVRYAWPAHLEADSEAEHVAAGPAPAPREQR